MTDNPLGIPTDAVSPNGSPLTWAGLLAHWVQLAQAASVLPDDKLGTSWKQSVAPAITLHAVAMALGDLDNLDTDERALAKDRAEVLINREAKAIEHAWQEQDVPSKLHELVGEARAALSRVSADRGPGL